jgi:hypothetical protein
MKSPKKDHFFIEKIARRMFDVVKVDKAGIHESGSTKEKVSNIYIEAKKHLSENPWENTIFF